MELERFNFVELTDEQLNQLLADARKEEERRYTTKRKTLWANVQKAIEEFISEVGPITISDQDVDIFFSSAYNFDYSALGTISVSN